MPDTVTPQSIRSDVEYVVLEKDDSGYWREASARVPAKSPEAAITTAIGEKDPGTAEYVAVASRYWSPVAFEVKVERSLIPKAAKS